MKIGFEFIKKILNQMESGQKKPKGEVSFSSLMKDKKAKNKKIVALNANLKKESKALKAKCSHSALDRMVQSSEGKKAVKEPKKGLEGKKIGETKKSLKKLDKDLTNVSNLESPKKLMDLEKSINKENKLSTLKSIKTEETAAGIQEINKEKLEKKKKQKEQHLFLLADVVPFNSQVASEPKALQKKELESNKKPGLILIERPEVIQIKEQKKDQLSQLKKNAAEALLNSKNQKSNSSKKTKAITKNGDLKSAAEKESIKLNKQQKTAGNSEIKVPDAVSALQSQSSADKVLELPKSSSPLNQDKSISVGEWSSLMAGEGQELLDKKSQNKKGTQNGSFSGGSF